MSLIFVILWMSTDEFTVFLRYIVESTPPLVRLWDSLFVFENNFAGYLVNISLSQAILSEINAPPY